MAKVSVIVPVFGVEKYIEKCARSLFEQTLDDMEFIFVDDCTIDNSIRILQKVISDYPSRAEQILLIQNDRNLGLPRARKRGLDESSGEYIAHCDSDDWVDPTLYEKMYESAINNDSDIVVCDFRIITNHGITSREGTRTSDLNQYTRNLIFQSDPLSMTNKLIRRSIYSEPILFPTLNMGEDMATTLQLIRHCHSISYIEDAFYYYNGRSASITREETKLAVLTRAIQASENAKIAINAYQADYDKYCHAFVHLKFNQRKHFMPIINHSDAYKIWKETFPEINLHVLFDPWVKIGFLDRLKFFLTLIGIFPWIKEHTRKNLK